MTMKMTKPETTTAALDSNYQTESDGSTALTRRAKEIADKIEAEQHSNLSSALILGTLSKKIITKPIQFLFSQSETRCVSKPVRGPPSQWEDRTGTEQTGTGPADQSGSRQGPKGQEGIKRDGFNRPSAYK